MVVVFVSVNHTMFYYFKHDKLMLFHTVVIVYYLAFCSFLLLNFDIRDTSTFNFLNSKPFLACNSYRNELIDHDLVILFSIDDV